MKEELPYPSNTEHRCSQLQKEYDICKRGPWSTKIESDEAQLVYD